MLNPHVYPLTRELQARIVQQATDELSRQPAVIFAYLYGSALDGEAVHDVDIGIHLAESESGQAATIVDALASHLSQVLGLPIDVRILNRAPLTFLYHVLRGRLLCSRNDDLLSAVLEDVARRYLDLALLLRQAAKTLSRLTLNPAIVRARCTVSAPSTNLNVPFSDRLRLSRI